MDLKLVPAGSVVPATKEFDGIHQGLIEAATGAIAYLKDKWPAATIFTYTVGGMGPFETMLWWDVGGGKELAHNMAKDYDVMMFRGQWTPPEVFLESKKALNTPADFKGLKVRASGDGAEVMNAMGASAIFLPVGELYQSLQSGVIDATEISHPALDWSVKIQEATKYTYMSPLRQPADGGPIFVK
jgi:TRAP-type mannitol/chloroaromatic compound transport system substrate-binding protein